jgi:hypothetical protein
MNVECQEVVTDVYYLCYRVCIGAKTISKNLCSLFTIARLRFADNNVSDCYSVSSPVIDSGNRSLSVKG